MDPTGVQENGGMTPLHFTVRRLDGGSYEATLALVSTLLHQGADPRAPNRHGGTVLHFLVEKLDRWNEAATVAVVTKLLEHRADPNAEDEYGFHGRHTC